MAFLIKKQDLRKKHKEATKEFTHEIGITISFRSIRNPDYMRAEELLQRSLLTYGRLTTKSVSTKAGKDDLNIFEAKGYAIAEHLIADWDLATEEDGKLEVNGENFAMLISQLEKPDDFLQWCLDCAEQFAEEIYAEAQSVTKKPSKGGSGSKNIRD